MAGRPSIKALCAARTRGISSPPQPPVLRLGGRGFELHSPNAKLPHVDALKRSVVDNSIRILQILSSYERTRPPLG